MIRLNRRMRKILSAWRKNWIVSRHLLTINEDASHVYEFTSRCANRSMKTHLRIKWRNQATNNCATVSSESNCREQFAIAKKIVGMLQNFLHFFISINRKNTQHRERNKIIIDHNCIIGKVNLLRTHECYWLIWIFALKCVIFFRTIFVQWEKNDAWSSYTFWFKI